MKNFHNLIWIVVSITLMTLMTGCGGGGETSQNLPSNQNIGTISFNLTDAPTDDRNIKGVYVTFTGLRYQYTDNDDLWEYVEFNESRTINLLALQDGNTTLLHEIELPTGMISHVNFIIDTNECYVDLYVGGLQPLEVIGGDEIGFEAFGGFTIKAGQTTSITADFDVRKSLKLTESGEYILSPFINVVDNDDVGCIKGNVDLTLTRDITSVIIYTYEDKSWNINESNATNNFHGAVSSNSVKDKAFILPWLPTGTYDLVVVAYDSYGGVKKILGYIDNATVMKCDITSQNITNETLLDMLP